LSGPERQEPNGSTYSGKIPRVEGNAASPLDVPSFLPHHDVMIRAQIQFDAEDFERVRLEASRQNCSISAFVRRGVTWALSETEAVDRREQARKLVGRYRSGVTDLARSHDAYLDHGW